jgi:hypothetical protein
MLRGRSNVLGGGNRVGRGCPPPAWGRTPMSLGRSGTAPGRPPDDVGAAQDALGANPMLQGAFAKGKGGIPTLSSPEAVRRGSEPERGPWTGERIRPGCRDERLARHLPRGGVGTSPNAVRAQRADQRGRVCSPYSTESSRPGSEPGLWSGPAGWQPAAVVGGRSPPNAGW